MKRLSSLETLGLWARSHRWAELRRFSRDTGEGVFAGLKIRGRSHIVPLYDWSPGGACVRLPGAAKLGERVQVVSGSLRGTGRIVWLNAGRAGIEFDL